MRFSTIGYCFQQGFKNIWRNNAGNLTLPYYFWSGIVCCVQIYRWRLVSASNKYYNILYCIWNTSNVIWFINRRKKKTENLQVTAKEKELVDYD